MVNTLILFLDFHRKHGERGNTNFHINVLSVLYKETEQIQANISSHILKSVKACNMVCLMQFLHHLVQLSYVSMTSPLELGV